MLIKRICFVLICIFVASCASTRRNRDAQKELKRLTSQGKFTKAIELVKGDGFFPEKRSTLLKKLELANLYYLKGQYFQSLKTFDAAKDLSDKLYTKSLSKAVKAAITNANQDNYYGEKYERSMLRFYLALIHFNIYLHGKYEKYSIFEKLDNGKLKEKKIPEKVLSLKERRQHLFSARAMILEWDSLLSNYKELYEGESTYKTDLMAKVLGAFIHEQIGTRGDKNIAKQLYKDAKNILFKYYSLYPTFNSKYKSFSENYKKFPKMSKNKIKKKYIVETIYAKSLLEFIEKRLRDLKSKNKDNLKIILKDGFIAKKKARKIDFPLPLVRIGYVSGRNSDLFTFTLELLAISAGTKPSISYELPDIEKQKQETEYFAVVKDKNNKEVLRSKIYLINPLSDIAWKTLNNKTSSLNVKIGTRVALKHVAAILAAYQIYKTRPDAFGKLAAGISYAAANKAIEASELVDLRFWSTLPHNIRMGSMKLQENKSYKLLIEVVNGDSKYFTHAEEIKLEKGKTKTIDLNLYKAQKLNLVKNAPKAKPQ